MSRQIGHTDSRRRSWKRNMPALSDVINRVSVTGAGNRSNLRGDRSLVRRSRSAAAGTAYGVVVPLGPRLRARSTSRSAAAPRASGPSCSPAARRPGELGAVPVLAAGEDVPVARQQRPRGDELLGMPVAGEPQPGRAAVCGVPQPGHGGLGFAVGRAEQAAVDDPAAAAAIVRNAAICPPRVPTTRPRGKREAPTLPCRTDRFTLSQSSPAGAGTPATARHTTRRQDAVAQNEWVRRRDGRHDDRHTGMRARRAQRGRLALEVRQVRAVIARWPLGAAPECRSCGNQLADALGSRAPGHPAARQFSCDKSAVRTASILSPGPTA